MRYLLSAAAVAAVLLLEHLLRVERRRRAQARRLPPDLPVEEHLSESGRFRATVYPHDTDVMRFEVFERLEDQEGAPRWRRVSPPSFVDRKALPAIIDEALRNK